ncbi:MAG TPA: DinB family protein [Dehalococcoidia bacterium]
MYDPQQLAMFAIDEFERGLEGLTEDEAAVRAKKADGSSMNAISWTVAHIAGHWLHRPERLHRYRPGSDDPAPPSLVDAMAWLREGREYTEEWLGRATPELMLRVPPGNVTGGENVGTALMRATLHTWFHAGEINAIRQMLGHKEIPYVGQLLGHLEWKP